MRWKKAYLTDNTDELMKSFEVTRSIRHAAQPMRRGDNPDAQLSSYA